MADLSAFEMIVVLGRCVVGGVLVAAGLAKVGDLTTFATELKGLPIVGAIVKDREGPAALGLASTELILGMLLIVGLWPSVTGVLVVTLLLLFTALIVVSVLRGERRPCGCFGARRRRAMSWWSVARNVVLIALGLVGMAGPATPSSGIPFGMDPWIVAVLLAIGTAGFLLTARQGWGRIVTEATLGVRGRRLGEAEASNLYMTAASMDGGRGDAAPGGRRPHSAIVERLAHVKELDRRASRLLGDVEHVLGKDDVGSDLHRTLVRARTRLEPKEGALLQLETELGESFTALYRQAAEESDPARSDRVLVRLALLHWTALVRQRTMRSLHTVVEGLEDDPDCRGGVVADALLAEYFEALFLEGAEREQEVAAVRALAGLARQSACLGTQQSAMLASAMYWAFIDLRGFLRFNGVERLLPAVVQALASPLLLFYDVEKWRGGQSPLARFFQDNSSELTAGVRTRRHPAVWHGLWLYDRMTGHLIGFRHSAKPVDENDVNAELFFASIAQRENLGRYDCSFSEMVQRGAGTNGYLCAGSTCRDGADSPPRRSGPIGRFFMRVGFSAGTVKDTACQDGGSGGRGSSGGGSPCAGGGVSVRGQSRAAATIRCLSEQVVRPMGTVLSCIGEATGICSSPVDKITKDLQQAAYGGVKVGRDCAISSGMGDLKVMEQYLDELRQAQAEAYKTLVAATREYNTLAAEARQAALEKEEVWADPQYDDDIKAIAKAEADAAARAADLAAAALVAAMRAETAARKKLDDAEAGAKKGAGTDGGQQRCPPDTPNCGGNGCTAMSESMLQTMSCLSKDLQGEQLGFGRRPGVVDPSPLEDPAAPAWLNCLQGASGGVASPTAKTCWAVDCGPQNGTFATASGDCGCGPQVAGVGGDSHLRGQCDHINCGDSTPVYSTGGCRCVEPGVVTPPKGPFGFDSPRSFSSVRRAEFDPSEPFAFSGFPP